MQNIHQYIYFRLGRVVPYSEYLYYYDLKNKWHYYDDQNVLIKNINNINIITKDTITFEDVCDFLKNHNLNAVADVVTNKHTWGILFKKTITDELYLHKINHKIWIKLLKNEKIRSMFNNYNEYVSEEKPTDSFKIKTTEDDDEISKYLIPKNLYNLLTNHQKHEIGWMYKWENTGKLYLTLQHTPIFDTGLYYNPENYKILATTKVSNDLKIDASCGILASETGTGKTVSMIGLLSTDIVNKITIPSLIIVTVNILYQWYEEIKKFCPDLKILVIENETELSKVNNEKYFDNYNIILTHRENILKNKFLKKKYWGRIVFDEIHEILKNKIYLRIFSKLNACFKWGVTGTFGDTDLISLSSIFKLLNFTTPKSINNVTKEFSNITKLFYSNGIRKNPKPILPKIFFSKIITKMNQFQKLVYKSESVSTNINELCSHLTDFWKDTEYKDIDNTKNNHDVYVKELIKIIMKKRTSEIKRLTNILKVEKNKNEITKINNSIIAFQTSNDYFQEIIKIIELNIYECPICMENFDNLSKIVIPDCMHQYCDDCFNQFAKHTNSCVQCNTLIDHKNVIIYPHQNEKYSTKIDKIIEEVKKENDKIILFTQFDNLAKHICDIFNKKNIGHIILQGVPSELNISLNKFKHDKNIKVLIMSIEQSASGLNILEAPNIYFAHPIFNYTYQEANVQYLQCIGRSYRYGQKKNVNVKFFITEDTIEEDLIKQIKI